MIAPIRTPTKSPAITVKAARKLSKKVRLNTRALITTRAVALYSPVFKALCGSAFPMAFTKAEPIIEAMMPAAESKRGKRTPAS